MNRRLFLPILFALPLCFGSAVLADAPKAALLEKDAKLAIIGDSITEQKQYTRFMEAYIVACAGRKDVKVFQFGWSGETAAGFAQRLQNDLGGFAPTVATLCYGMNDGRYIPYNDEVGKNYENTMRDVLGKLKKAGVAKVVVGSPGAVDTEFFKKPTGFGPEGAAAGYNDNLNHLGQIGQKLAGEFQQTFTNVHQPMIDAMAKGKAALGAKYDVGGGDGVHPNANGQLVMAYAFLRGLGFDGNLAEISVDMKGSAKASEGHKVLTASNGAVELESDRYPFCFQGDENSSGGTRSIIRFMPFNEELNRFTLKVANLSAAKARVEWGSETKEFSKEQLEKGVNLAAAFSKTPFDGVFTSYLQALSAKQGLETTMIKSLITSFRNISGELKSDAELMAALETVKKRLFARQQELDAKARAVLVPVKHTLKITPLS